MNDTAIDALLSKNKHKTTDAKNTQQHGGVTHGGRTTRPEVTTDTKDTQERGGVAHGGCTLRPQVTTDTDNTQQCGGVAHGGHDGAAVEGATTEALGTTRPDVFELTGNTKEIEDSNIKKNTRESYVRRLTYFIAVLFDHGFRRCLNYVSQLVVADAKNRRSTGRTKKYRINFRGLCKVNLGYMKRRDRNLPINL